MLSEVFLTFFASICVMFTIIYFFNKWHPLALCIDRRNKLCWKCLVPFLVAALVVLNYPIQHSEGYQSDLRAVPIAMAGYIGGPVAGLIVGAATAVYRIFVTGIYIKSLAAWVLIGPTAYYLRRYLPWKTFSFQDILVLSLMATMYSYFGGFSLPDHIREQFYNPGILAMKGLLCFFGMYAIALAIRVQVEDTRMVAGLNEKASRDSLTGLLNHGSFARQAELLLRHSKMPGIFMLIDLDYFKRINDQCGHLYGDNVLRFIAQVFSEKLRDHDIVGRIGGEEFGILLPQTALDDAMNIATRIQERALEYKNSELECEHRLTMSVGVARYHPGKKCDFEKIFQRADEALYQAKERGRNRIEVYKN